MKVRIEACDKLPQRATRQIQPWGDNNYHITERNLAMHEFKTISLIERKLTRQDSEKHGRDEQRGRRRGGLERVKGTKEG